MFFGYFLKYFSRTIKILEKSKDLQIDHQAYFLMLPKEIYCITENYFSFIHLHWVYLLRPTFRNNQQELWKPTKKQNEINVIIFSHVHIIIECKREKFTSIKFNLQNIISKKCNAVKSLNFSNESCFFRSSINPTWLNTGGKAVLRRNKKSLVWWRLKTVCINFTSNFIECLLIFYFVEFHQLDLMKRSKFNISKDFFEGLSKHFRKTWDDILTHTGVSSCDYDMCQKMVSNCIVKNVLFWSAPKRAWIFSE